MKNLVYLSIVFAVMFTACETENEIDQELRAMVDTTTTKLPEDTVPTSANIFIPAGNYMGNDFNGYTHYVTFSTDSVHTAIRLSTSSDEITSLTLEAEYVELESGVTLCNIYLNSEVYDYKIIFREGDNFILVMESWESIEFENYLEFSETGSRVVCFEVENFPF